MPGRLTKALRGQHLALVTAMGITGAPHSMARRVPLLRYLPFSPRGMRVPSGNMMTHTPWPSRRRPCCTTLAKDSMRRPRSMWIMSSRAMAQPKNGTDSSSRLNT